MRVFRGEKGVDEKSDEALARWHMTEEPNEVAEKENNLMPAGIFSMNPVDFEKRLQ